MQQSLVKVYPWYYDLPQSSVIVGIIGTMERLWYVIGEKLDYVP